MNETFGSILRKRSCCSKTSLIARNSKSNSARWCRAHMSMYVQMLEGDGSRFKRRSILLNSRGPENSVWSMMIDLTCCSRSLCSYMKEDRALASIKQNVFDFKYISSAWLNTSLLERRRLIGPRESTRCSKCLEQSSHKQRQPPSLSILFGQNFWSLRRKLVEEPSSLSLGLRSVWG